MIDGNTLIRWGFKPGAWFKEALVTANEMLAKNYDEDSIFQAMCNRQPVEIAARTNALPYANFLHPEGEQERENATLVHEAMDKLMRIPTVRKGAIMPDACPAGTIPVGGVVATENAIHPGFHSADICCSMAISVFKRPDDPKRVLDVIQALTHFGPSKRAKFPAEFPGVFASFMQSNPFLAGLEAYARYHFTTQGDGNHFYFVGHLESTGDLAIVSHHGSRGLGAQLYKRGMAAAQRHTKKIAPRVSPKAAWLYSESDEGRDYWAALQFVRLWTKSNHLDMHDLIARQLGNKVIDRFWNEHNFVFRRDDGLFYHAKGATPSYAGFSEDDDGRTLIPMNMAEPILITEHTNVDEALGFAPHGAGRNMSRSQHIRDYDKSGPFAEMGGAWTHADAVAHEAKGIDARFWCGIPDISELPGAYKPAAGVIAAIEKHSLAKISDRVIPYGSIMAGDWERDAPWKKGKR